MGSLFHHERSSLDLYLKKDVLVHSFIYSLVQDLNKALLCPKCWEKKLKKSKKIKTCVLSASEEFITHSWGWRCKCVHLICSFTQQRTLTMCQFLKLEIKTTQSLSSGPLSLLGRQTVVTVKCSRRQFRGKIKCAVEAQWRSNCVRQGLRGSSLGEATHLV